MATDLDKYTFVVRPLAEEEGGGYLCEFPDVPGCMGDGETPEEAIQDGKAALWSCIETFRELDRKTPAPAAASGNWRMRAPKSLHRRLVERAKLEGVSLNTLAVSLLAEGLGARDPVRQKRAIQRERAE